MKLRASTVQLHHIPGDKPANLARIREWTLKARSARAELVIFPEMCITGYWHVRNLNRDEILELSETVDEGQSVKTLSDLSRETGLTIGAGFIERDAEENLFNSYLLVTPSGEKAVHRKLHAFINPEISCGSNFTIFQLPQGITVGVLTCYDCNIIENVRLTALAGADILLAPHQTGGTINPSPYCMGGIDPDLWHRRHEDPEALRRELVGPKGRDWLMRWLPARAHDNGMFLLFSNGIGLDDNEVRTGNAMILDPYGAVLAESRHIDEDLVTADLDMDLLNLATGRTWIKSRRPELYAPLAESTGKEESTITARFENIPRQ